MGKARIIKHGKLWRVVVYDDLSDLEAFPCEDPIYTGAYEDCLMMLSAYNKSLEAQEKALKE